MEQVTGEAVPVGTDGTIAVTPYAGADLLFSFVLFFCFAQTGIDINSVYCREWIAIQITHVRHP